MFATLGVLFVLGVLTWWVLESSEVAVVTTRQSNGEIRSTHVWHVRDGGELWLEAGSPHNGWYRDVLRDPDLDLSLGDAPRAFRAEPVHDASAQQRVRTLIRRKYGFRDIWIGLLVDHSEAVAVRLVPASDPSASEASGATRGPSVP